MNPAQGISILAVVVLSWPRPLAGLLAAGYAGATLGALLISLSVGLFGFRESISASYVTESLTIETITVVALIIWTVLVTAIPGADRRPRPAARRLDRSPAAARRRPAPWGGHMRARSRQPTRSSSR